MIKTITHGSLFSGFGGFDIASECPYGVQYPSIGWKNVFNCEIEPFPRKILNYYWPQAKNYEDITKTDFSIWNGKLNVISGGFPCQSFSVAGKRGGINDDRYLWPEMLRAIRESQPDAVVGENVTGLLTMEKQEVFARVDSRNRVHYEDCDHYEAIYTRQAELLFNYICEDLEKEGYKVQPFVIPAAGAGAPHKRDRVWIIAYRDSRLGKWKEKQLQARGNATDGSHVANTDIKHDRRHQPRKKTGQIQQPRVSSEQNNSANTESIRLQRSKQADRKKRP